MVVNSVPRIIVEAFGFIPILMAYIVLGLASFSNSERFSDFNNSIVTFYSLMLGDSIGDITLDLMSNIPNTMGAALFALFFVITFVLTFMLTVQTLWVAMIMQDFSIKSKEIKARRKQ